MVRGLQLPELNSAQEVPQVLPHLTVTFDLCFLSSSSRWHFLYLRPLPHQQSSFLPRLLGWHSSSPDAKIVLRRFKRLIFIPRRSWYCSFRLQTPPNRRRL